MKFAVRYDAGSKAFAGLDQYYGATSLLGVSQLMLIALNAFFNKEIITQAPSAKGFRLILGTSKTGSWEQVLHLVITDPQVVAIAEDMGRSALYDFLKMTLLNGVGLGGGFILKNRKAAKRIRELERENDDLQERLDEAIKRIHQPVKHQGLSVHVMAGRQALATFDDATLAYIETEVEELERSIIEAAVSRFNARTGTGRFITKMDAASVPFVPQEKLLRAHSAVLADNLALVTRGVSLPVEVIVSRVTSKDGPLKRYRLHGLA
jgi:hypothetical protein